MSTEIEWPWQYNFPPFFTLQPHSETKMKQITAWKSLIIEYFKTNKLCVLDIRESSDLPLFNNPAINRSLETKALLEILNDLQSSGNASPLDKQKNRWEIYWHTLEEFGTLIYNYVNDSSSLNTVMTIFELTEGDEVQAEEFYKLSPEVFIKALKVLEKEGKCEIIIFDDSQGVKFF